MLQFAMGLLTLKLVNTLYDWVKQETACCVGLEASPANTSGERSNDDTGCFDKRRRVFIGANMVDELTFGWTILWGRITPTDM